MNFELVVTHFDGQEERGEYRTYVAARCEALKQARRTEVETVDVWGNDKRYFHCNNA